MTNEVQVLEAAKPDLDRPLHLSGGLSLAEVKTIGQTFHLSGMFTDVKSAAQAVTKILAGQELGIPPMQAMQGYHVINGQPRLSASLIAALVKRSGRYDYRVREANDTLCSLEWFQDGESVGESDFTFREAEAAGLVKGGGGWMKYREDMLFARALTRGARRYCPDVFGGAVYTLGEDAEDTDERPEPHRLQLPKLRSPNPGVAADASPSGASPPAPDGEDTYVSAEELEALGQTRLDEPEIPS